MTRARQKRGRAAEDVAIEHLRGAGCRIVQRNFRCRIGEIDIVADDRGTLVFVEVRSRQTARFGTAVEAVTAAKQRQVLRVAQVYLARRGPVRCRFDVIGITGDQVTWIRDAFRA
jgi:putative endonuclease